MTTPWYEAAFGEHYSDLYSHRDDNDARRAVDFLERVARVDPRQGPVLDLCCGHGRHALEWLGRGGAAVVGFDLSAQLLESAAGAARDGRMDLPLVRGDMRHLPFRDRTFPLVLNLFTSFGYFKDERENEAVLAGAARVLRPSQGRLLLDHINPLWLRANLQGETTRATPGGIQVRESRRICERARRVEKEVEFTTGGATHSFVESVRFYEPAEFREMGERCGLDLLAAYGDYDGSPLSDASPRAIYVFRPGADHQTNV